MSITVQISLGELVDKVSILDIKTERMRDEQKKANVRKELALLKAIMEHAGISCEDESYRRLKSINEALWEIEDNIRIKEKEGAFDQEFIALARSVYFTNDDRAAVKKEINLRYDSELIEEKEYVEYKSGVH